MNKLVAIIGLIAGIMLIPAGIGIPMVVMSVRELTK
jgi:hypothetical protein